MILPARRNITADDALLTWVSYIPEGNSACVNFLAVQRDPRNFSPFPNTFWPDRWLVAKGVIECPVPEGEFVHEMSAFVPFSFGKLFLDRRQCQAIMPTFDIGPAACVGRPLALLGEFHACQSKRLVYNVPIIELRMATAYLVRDLDLKFAPGYKETWESDWQDYLVFQKGKIPIIASLRA